MASIVWCDRTPFRVHPEQSTIEKQIEDLKGHYSFIWLDLQERTMSADGTRKQIALRIDKISCIEKATDAA